MKRLKVLAFCVFFSLACNYSFAQTAIPLNEPDYNKPKIFSDLPQQMILQSAQAEQLFLLRNGETGSVQITTQFLLTGTVISKGGNKTLLTIVMKIPSRNNSIFTLTRTIAPGGMIAYRGRMMNRDNGDAYEIKEENSQFIFNKINLYDLISE